MKQLPFLSCVILACGTLMFTGCKDPVVENKPKVEAQWKGQVQALISGDKAGFQNLMCAATKAQPTKVDFAYGVAHGLAQALKTTAADVRIEDIAFNKEFTQATLKTAYKDAKEPTGWKPFPDAEIWVKENGQWLRQL